MIKLLKNAEVYTPEYIGKKDILIADSKIAKIGDSIDIDESLATIIDLKGKKVVPGFIDSHVHICGGGGEGSFRSRTPEIQLTDMTTAGVTTVIGVLGTDGTTRTMTNLIAKAKGLKEEGVSAFVLTGSYEIPVRTLTGKVTDDIILIEEVIGCGELAVADHRSSHPTADELLRVASDTRLGGILSGKAGIIGVHMGDSHEVTDLLLEAIDKGAVPIKQFVPTHMNRNPYLFEAALKYGKRGGNLDFTTSTTPEFLADGEVKCGKATRLCLEAGIDISQITYTSDGQGSLPEYDAEGNFKGVKLGKCETLYEAVKEGMEEEKLKLEEIIKVITSNPATTFKLKGKGFIEEGFDADLVILDENLDIDSVLALGKVMVQNKVAIVKGTFEK